MNRQEPYVGMPIILATPDEERAERQTRQSTGQAVQMSPVPVAACDTVCTAAENRQPMVLAMAYVPWQRWQETYPLEEGFKRGTIFPELDFPFEGKKRGGMRR